MVCSRLDSAIESEAFLFSFPLFQIKLPAWPDKPPRHQAAVEQRFSGVAHCHLSKPVSPWKAKPWETMTTRGLLYRLRTERPRLSPPAWQDSHLFQGLLCLDRARSGLAFR